ncbi:MAG: hypothetical protein Hals2KO_30260 [Halioglobus sp.]
MRSACQLSEVKVSFPHKVVGIVGMHRSGTSCLTGSLQAAGLYLAEIHTWNPHNLKGNRENQRFVDLHDNILAANGGSWDFPPREVKWRPEHIAAARELLAEHGSQRFFGFKDPRTLLMVNGWKTLVPDIQFIGIFRHPNAVAQSLAKRSAKSREESLGLWYRYNIALFEEYKRRPFPILDFDQEAGELDARISRVATALGLPGRKEGETFYTDELRNNASTDMPGLPWRIKRLYRRLQRISV